MTRLKRAIAAAALVAAAWRATPAAALLPFRLAVDVRWGPGGGSEAFRADLARSLADALSQRCFSTVEDVSSDGTESTPADVRLLAYLSNVREQLRFLDSIATSLQSDDPSNELRRVAILEVAVEASLQAVVTGEEIAQKRLVASISRQPVMIGEDPQATARALAIDRIVQDLTKAVCKGGDKLEKKIREAMREPEGNAPVR